MRVMNAHPQRPLDTLAGLGRQAVLVQSLLSQPDITDYKTGFVPSNEAELRRRLSGFADA